MDFAYNTVAYNTVLSLYNTVLVRITVHYGNWLTDYCYMVNTY